jgi:hypothetical protein
MRIFEEDRMYTAIGSYLVGKAEDGTPQITDEDNHTWTREQWEERLDALIPRVSKKTAEDLVRLRDWGRTALAALAEG